MKFDPPINKSYAAQVIRVPAIVIRVSDGAAVPALYKLKSGVFLAHETRPLDEGEGDLESAA